MAYSNSNALPRAEISQAVFEAQSNSNALPFIGLEVLPVYSVAAGTVASAGGVTVGFAINAGTTNDIIEVAVPVKSF